MPIVQITIEKMVAIATKNQTTFCHLFFALVI